MRVGFAGLGLMGEPMAARLCAAGLSPAVFNRSPEPVERLRKLGAIAAADPASLFERSDVILLMLRDDTAVDAVLGRSGSALAVDAAGKLVVNMGTHAPAFSRALDTAVRHAGGRFVEAPVSGSRGPAEQGALVAMLAGDPEVAAQVRPLLAPMCRETIVTGAVPSATAMKLTVNLYLIASVAALAEAASMAIAYGVELGHFRDVIAAGPLRSDVAVAKLDKMRGRDFAPQAAIADVCRNAALVSAAATECGAAAPLLNRSRELFEAVLQRGGGSLDMAAVITAFDGEGEAHG